MKIEPTKPLPQTIKVVQTKPKPPVQDYSERFIAERVRINKDGKISIRV